MESGSPQPSEELVSTNSAVQLLPTQNSAKTQIFLIKEEIPNSAKGLSTRTASTYLNRSDKQEFVRISENSSSKDLALSINREATMVISNDLSQSDITTKSTNEAGSAFPPNKRKSKNATKNKDSKANEGSNTCDKCKKSFAHEASLKAHVRRTYCQEAKSLVIMF